MKFVSQRLFFAYPDLKIRYRPRFFDEVGHQTTYASVASLHHVIVRPTKIMNRADKNWAHF